MYTRGIPTVKKILQHFFQIFLHHRGAISGGHVFFENIENFEKMKKVNFEKFENLFEDF